jgi:glycosyltransferase involved in cell wall biosynthesis
MTAKPLSVMIATEGTYPFYRGGVSTWCDRLTHGLPDIEFKVFALTTDPFTPSRYTLAPNVSEVVRAPQWGFTQPAEYHSALNFHSFRRHRKSTSSAAVEIAFKPLFEQFLSLVFAHSANPMELGEVLVSLHFYFRTHDYQVTMNSATAWSVFVHAARATYENRPAATERPSFGEVKQAFRLLYHLLTVLHTKVPQVDLVHSSAAAFCGIPCILSKLMRGTPYLLTEHGVYLREQYLNLRSQIQSFFVRWFLYRLCGALARLSYQLADQISPVCAYNARWEKKLSADPQHIRVIFNGVDPGTFQRCVPAPKSRPRISTVGLIYPLKGQSDLIRATALIKRELPEVEVLIYGASTDADYYGQCQSLVAEKQLENNVTFAGITKEPWRVYSEADIVVLPSISEGFPYVVVEAMMCGAAIVATDVGGVREALGCAGLLTPSRNPAALARAILFLLHNPSERQRLGAMAMARALELFTEDRFLRSYRAAYWDLYLGMRPRTLLLAPEGVSGARPY